MAKRNGNSILQMIKKQYPLHIKIWFKMINQHKIDVDKEYNKKEINGIQNLYNYYAYMLSKIDL